MNRRTRLRARAVKQLPKTQAIQSPPGTCSQRVDFRIHERLVDPSEPIIRSGDGIPCFVPWSSGRSFTVFGDTLFIELSASLCPVVVAKGQTFVVDSRNHPLLHGSRHLCRGIRQSIWSGRH